MNIKWRQQMADLICLISHWDNCPVQSAMRLLLEA